MKNFLVWFFLSGIGFDDATVHWWNEKISGAGVYCLIDSDAMEKKNQYSY